jgi:LmbE family N-acetylglucosaminyl deacetylase
VSFHAHPDDEALLTGGTLARAAAEGHRVVLVTATDGDAGLSRPSAQGISLGAQRLAELERAGEALGCARIVHLGYLDSGSEQPTLARRDGAIPFALLDPPGPAERLAEVLREESADVLTLYDQFGGYGHPDHVQVHRVGHLAAVLAGTPVVLEATVDRGLLGRVAGAMDRIPGLRRLIPDDRFGSAYLARDELTHEIDVRPHLRAKKAALAAHHSQSTGAGVRTVGLLLRLPSPLFRKVLGREWFRQDGMSPGGALSDDIFASLR